MLLSYLHINDGFDFGCLEVNMFEQEVHNAFGLGHVAVGG